MIIEVSKYQYHDEVAKNAKRHWNGAYETIELPGIVLVDNPYMCISIIERFDSQYMSPQRN